MRLSNECTSAILGRSTDQKNKKSPRVCDYIQLNSTQNNLSTPSSAARAIHSSLLNQNLLKYQALATFSDWYWTNPPRPSLHPSPGPIHHPSHRNPPLFHTGFHCIPDPVQVLFAWAHDRWANSNPPASSLRRPTYAGASGSAPFPISHLFPTAWSHQRRTNRSDLSRHSIHAAAVAGAQLPIADLVLTLHRSPEAYKVSQGPHD